MGVLGQIAIQELPQPGVQVEERVPHAEPVLSRVLEGLPHPLVGNHGVSPTGSAHGCDSTSRGSVEGIKLREEVGSVVHHALADAHVVDAQKAAPTEGHLELLAFGFGPVLKVELSE